MVPTSQSQVYEGETGLWPHGMGKKLFSYLVKCSDPATSQETSRKPLALRPETFW